MTVLRKWLLYRKRRLKRPVNNFDKCTEALMRKHVDAFQSLWWQGANKRFCPLQWRSGTPSVFPCPLHYEVVKLGLYDGLLLWACPGFMMMICRHRYPRGPELYLKDSSYTFNLGAENHPHSRKWLKTPKLHFLGLNMYYVPKYKWMEINFRSLK